MIWWTAIRRSFLGVYQTGEALHRAEAIANSYSCPSLGLHLAHLISHWNKSHSSLLMDHTCPQTQNDEDFTTFNKVFGSRAVKYFGERFGLALILGELHCHAVAYSNTQDTQKESISYKRRGSFPPSAVSADYAKTWSHFCLSIFIAGPSSWWTMPGLNSSALDDAGIQKPE